MTAPIKYLSCLAALWMPCCAIAQQPAPPAQLSATYKKYTNRIELTWAATAADHRYIVKRREARQKHSVSIDTVPQNRYVDRNNLKTNTDYLYCVQSVASTGAASTPSTEATGALLSVAGDRDAQPDSLLLERCVKITVLEGKTTGRLWVFKFLSRNTCPSVKSVQCTLYHSNDAVLDENDTLLAQQPFNLSRTRGVLTARNNLASPTGFLLLKVASEGQYFVSAKALVSQ